MKFELEADVILFEDEDVIVTSGGGGGNDWSTPKIKPGTQSEDIPIVVLG